MLMPKIVLKQVLLRLKGKKAEKLHHDEGHPISLQPFKMSYSEIRNATDNFSSELIIGEDSFCKVYYGTLHNGVQIAVRRYERVFSSSTLREFWVRLVELSQIEHQNFVSLIGFCDEMDEMISVHEYMENGTLAHHLGLLSDCNVDRPLSRPPELSWEQRLQICVDSAEALHYLHSNFSSKFTHGDVSLFNIFLDKNYTAKFADSGGVSKSVLFDAYGYVPEFKKTLHYVDPEYHLRERWTEKSDVYSFGVVLIEVLSGGLGFKTITVGKKNWRVARWGIHCVKKGKVSKIVDPVLVGKINPSSLKTFAQIAAKCLRLKGHQRPVMREVLWSLEFALELQQAGAPRVA